MRDWWSRIVSRRLRRWFDRREQLLVQAGYFILGTVSGSHVFNLCEAVFDVWATSLYHDFEWTESESESEDN